MTKSIVHPYLAFQRRIREVNPQLLVFQESSPVFYRNEEPKYKACYCAKLMLAILLLTCLSNSSIPCSPKSQKTLRELNNLSD
ncbi:hypothetical protein VIGAN_01264100 [Vigna angularis var. angularis]|uniref:Uncharacterized protein n=1 Tax=Vigna angularis var. angularis TaxID=157739 RepID=A0A0S3R2F9_PHAAN|nr:hypothetical protein VIGAN_01264100 [Vigna angularis var. angularis]